jgi:hypothetical protein
MAVKYECDRCHKQFDSADSLFQVTIQHKEYRDTTNSWEVCGQCRGIVELSLCRPPTTVNVDL